MTDLDEPSPPWLLQYQASRARAYELGWRLDRNGNSARMLRGWKMRTVATVFDEFGAALQFPEYFGENWAALDECLSDLSWMPANRYVLIVPGAEEVLADEPRAELEVLREVLVRSATAWAEPVSRGEAWDRPASPFHVMLQASIEVPGPWGTSIPDLR